MPARCGAIGNDHAEIVDQLLSTGLEYDLDCGYGRSALWRTAHPGRSEVVTKLLGRGAEANPDFERGNSV